MQNNTTMFQRKLKLRHTRDISEKLDEAMKILRKSENYLDKLHEEALNSLSEEEYSGY